MENYCTCKDTKCPYHPSNHDQGCTLCIQKNLKYGEIPSCFFNKVGNIDETNGYKIKDFAEFVLKQNK